MTTAHHTALAYGGPLSSAAMEAPLSALDAAIEAVILQGSGQATTLTAQANSGQPSLVVASSAGFLAGQYVYVGQGATYEGRVILAVPDATHITVTGNLTNTYVSGLPVSRSPIEIVDARGGASSLGARLSMFDRWAFDVRKYGATGDSTTDDQAAFAAAATAAGVSGGVVFGPPGTYRLASPWVLPSNVTFAGSGDETIIKVDHAAGGITASGSVAAGHTLAVNATRGTASAMTSVGGGASYVPGDTVVLQSEAQAQSLAGLKKGDIYRVASVAGDIVTMAGGLLDTYLTADTAKIRKVTPVTRIGLRDFRIYNTKYVSTPTVSTSSLINLELAIDVVIDRVTVEQNNGAGISVKSSMGVRIANCRIQDLRDDLANSIYGYGVAVGHASRQITVVGNGIRRVRHGFTTTTTAAASLLPGYGVPRGIVVDGNAVTDCTNVGLDTHEDGDGIAFVGNSVTACDYGGIQTRGWRTTIVGNSIFGIRGFGIRADASSVRPLISGNQVVACSADPAASVNPGIFVDTDFALVQGNYVFDNAGHGIGFAANANLGFSCTGNIVMNNGQAAAGTYDGINVNANTSRANIVGNSCLDDQTVKTQRYGLRIEAAYVNVVGQGIHVSANDLHGNLTGPYSNVGTGVVTSWDNQSALAPGHQQRVKQTTGSIALSAVVDVVVTLPYGFGDTNYTVSVTCEEATGALEVRAVKAKTSTTVTVTVKNNDAALARTGTLHVFAVHD